MSKEIIQVNCLPKKIINDSVFSINEMSMGFSHGIYKYPCRFIPEIPKWAIETYLPKDNKGKKIFDPFAGSGTTLVEGLLHGYASYGTEIDLLAKKIIKVKTTKLSCLKLNNLEDFLNKIEQLNMKQIQNWDKFIPEIKNIEHWFPIENIEKLAKLSSLIIKIDDIDIREFFEVVFASIIKKCSFADEVSPKPYVSTKIKKKVGNPYQEFITTAKKYLIKIRNFSEKSGLSSSELLSGDARVINSDIFFDLAITSPPYINAFDYPRTLRLENLWLNISTEDKILNSKNKYFGTEKINMNKEKQDLAVLDLSESLQKVYEGIYKVDEKRALIVKKFFSDMFLNLNMIYSHLNINSRYIIVIGNSNIRKVNIESWKIILEISLHCGFLFDNHFSYSIKNPWIRIPRKNKGGKIKEDHVLVLKKVGDNG